jgi:cytochrome c6
MNMKIRSLALAACFISMGAAFSYAQAAGEDTYKAKCLMCHGATGMAESPAGKAMKVKPVNDPDVKKLNEAQMIDAVRDGMGKMQAFKGKLTDAQIKDSVTYFRSLSK